MTGQYLTIERKKRQSPLCLPSILPNSLKNRHCIQRSGDRSPLYELCGIRFELLGTFIPCIIFAVHNFRTFKR